MYISPASVYHHQTTLLQTFTTAAELRDYRAGLNRPAAFVPTMGALHAGHMALIEAAVATGDRVIGSLFVNPTQFNDAEDLSAYPRTPERDLRLLAEHGCHAVYLPTVEDVYPIDYRDPTAEIKFGELVEVMEGANRPGHFAGVAQVVHRLLGIVQPRPWSWGRRITNKLP